MQFVNIKLLIAFKGKDVMAEKLRLKKYQLIALMQMLLISQKLSRNANSNLPVKFCHGQKGTHHIYVELSFIVRPNNALTV